MKLTQEFKNDFSQFLLKLFIVIWCASIYISIGGLSIQLYSDFNIYNLFVMLVIGFTVTIVLALVISLIMIFILKSIDSYQKFKKYAFEKENK